MLMSVFLFKKRLWHSDCIPSFKKGKVSIYVKRGKGRGEKRKRKGKEKEKEKKKKKRKKEKEERKKHKRRGERRGEGVVPK